MKVKVAILGSPTLIVLMVSVDVTEATFNFSEVDAESRSHRWTAAPGYAQLSTEEMPLQ